MLDLGCLGGGEGGWARGGLGQRRVGLEQGGGRGEVAVLPRQGEAQAATASQVM